MSGELRTPGYRNIFANTYSVVFTSGEVQIRCGVQLNPGSDDPAMEAEVNLIMTHAGAKLLISMVGMVMADFEEAIGQEIPIDPAKLASVKATVDASKAARDAAKTLKVDKSASSNALPAEKTAKAGNLSLPKRSLRLPKN